MRMETYEVTVYTGKVLFANTFHDIYIKLVGTDGESPPTRLINSTGPLAFSTGAVSTFTLSIPESIGKLLQVRLNKRPIKDFPQDTWFPAKVEVKTPERETFNFPIYRWITDNEEHFFREGKGLLVFEDTHPLGEYRREMELKEREEDYQWNVYAKGIPHCMKAANTESLPLEVRFSFTKTAEFQFTAAQGLTALKLSGLGELTDKWTDMDSIYRVFTSKITDISAYVQKHWREDEFFAYQFLNALNPMLIQRCSVIPKNFPVTDSMVFLDGRKTLKEEVKNGNIYLCDYKMLDGVETNTVNGKKQYLMAPLVLFHKTPDDKLMPIAIQLKQTPGEDNPIFFPTDSEYDWLLAKTFVRSADFNFHELSVHLLRTHLLAEVFAVSLLRNVPMVHPLYKLLVPHTRYTMQINFMARNLLISETGSFTTYAACGGEGMFTIMRRSMESMTYTSLCMPDDIAERGMKNLPNYYYRDDGLKLWDIIHKFVDGILSYYYKSDADVEKDCELQKWISDIFVHGFLSNAKTGIPQCFTTVAALVKFVTMAMFTCSVQHAAVNSGQFDYGAWMPNTPISLQLPPPTTKGTTTEDTMLQTLPDVNVTVQGMAVLHLLSMQATDFVPLGQYPDEHFSEEIPRKLIKRFQGDLEIQSVSTFTLSIPESIGKLLQVRLNKRPVTNFPEDTWFPAKVEVKTPEGETFNFPIYRWITDNEEHFFREGKALLVDEDTHPFGEYRREMELKEREEDYQWNVYAKGLPHCMKAASIESLPMEVRFSFTKNTEFQFTAAQGLTALKLSGLGELTDKWTDLDSIYRVFTSKITDISAYVQKHWREDEFFAYQFLNALNPMLIRRCSVIPKNFPVTDRMVFLDGRKTLKEEVKNSNIYLCDYKMLDGVETNTINGKKQYLMAPLVLLHKTPDDKLKPIAIQLKQTPGEDNPIFFPTDSEYDWLLAKIFVRSADVNFHGLSVHLLRTHLLADVFAVSLLRNVPMVHPLYKLLVPHTRYTLQINFLARNGLFSEDGTFSKYGASGGKGMFTILKRSMESLTYSSLCIPDDIAERGMGSIPNYYYRDDGLQLWNIIHRFVDGILSYYYKSDADVEKDCELQKWILDIFVQGFLSNAKTGIPQCFTTVAALVKFVTMVIFTCSLQHAAVNSGQFDFGAWMPNAPISLQLPPPTTKETTTEDTMLQTLPDVNVTVQGMTLFHLLSMQSTDFVPLGQYPEEHFSEEIPRKLIKRFQGDLEIQSVTIKVRNEFLDLPYTYMHPTVVENSVAM